ncbi:sulfite exporter TauE/SafE family protein [Anaplasmataceae bacterium AB001_6]|nr:sulfite exporter TauE/SafE family protein [Anaplasmataceae bacterium AB001_6]
MWLGILFTIVAIFYASVGFGGGSSYLALLALWDFPYNIMAPIALICNIVVVSGNTFHYVRAGYLNYNLSLPLTLTSVIAAYIGGKIEIEKELFIKILCITLLISGIRMLITYRRYDDNFKDYKIIPIWVSGIIGITLGFLSGLVGIGGGIFLAPILYSLKAGTPKQIATTSSIFILFNSIAGLIGQLQKHNLSETIVFDYWYLPMLVFLGGQISNIITIRFIPSRIVVLSTGFLVIFVAIRLGYKIWIH